MRTQFKTLVTAALSLILGAGATSLWAAPQTVVGGNSIRIGGWQIAPDPGISLNITGVSSGTLIIKSESVNFHSSSPLNVSFTKLSADAVAQIEFKTATVGNATSAGWKGYTFSLSGSAAFAGITDGFVPPVENGYDYTSVSGNRQNHIKYAGSQLAGVTSNWGATSSTDDLVIDADPTSTALPAADASFSMIQAPAFNEVRAPLALPQSLTGLLFVILITLLPRMRTANSRF